MTIKLPHFRPQRERRVRSLIAKGFDKKEAIAFTKPMIGPGGKKVTLFRLSPDAKTGKPKESAQTIQARKELMEEAKKRGESKREAIKRHYEEQDYFTKDGRRDPLAPFRHSLEDYPGSRTKRPGSIDKGRVAEQKARYREKYGGWRPPADIPLRGQMDKVIERAEATEDHTARQQLFGLANRMRQRLLDGEQ